MPCAVCGNHSCGLCDPVSAHTERRGKNHPGISLSRDPSNLPVTLPIQCLLLHRDLHLPGVPSLGQPVPQAAPGHTALHSRAFRILLSLLLEWLLVWSVRCLLTAWFSSTYDLYRVLQQLLVFVFLFSKINSTFASTFNLNHLVHFQ